MYDMTIGPFVDGPVVILTLVPAGVGCPPTMIGSRQIVRPKVFRPGLTLFGIHAERRDHIHPIRRATQSVARRYRESRRHIRRAGGLQKDRNRSAASAALQRKIEC